MKLLPIEPGCRAIVTNTCQQFSYLLGSEGKVGRHLHIDEVLADNGKCRLCGSSSGYYHISVGHVCACECSLMRIDGNDDQFRKEVARSQKPRQCVKASMD